MGNYLAPFTAYDGLFIGAAYAALAELPLHFDTASLKLEDSVFGTTYLGTANGYPMLSMSARGVASCHMHVKRTKLGEQWHIRLYLFGEDMKDDLNTVVHELAVDPSLGPVFESLLRHGIGKPLDVLERIGKFPHSNVPFSDYTAKQQSDYGLLCRDRLALDMLMVRTKPQTPIMVVNPRIKRLQKATLESIRTVARGLREEPWYQETARINLEGQRIDVAPLHSMAPIVG